MTQQQFEQDLRKAVSNAFDIVESMLPPWPQRELVDSHTRSDGAWVGVYSDGTTETVSAARPYYSCAVIKDVKDCARVDSSDNSG